jgi:hypothetical protein
MVAPKARKHLSADALFHLVRSGFATIPDPRNEEVDISLTDTLMSAFAMFSLKAPSLLAFDKERAECTFREYGFNEVNGQDTSQGPDGQDDLRERVGFVDGLEQTLHGGLILTYAVQQA